MVSLKDLKASFSELTGLDATGSNVWQLFSEYPAFLYDVQTNYEKIKGYTTALNLKSIAGWQAVVSTLETMPLYFDTKTAKQWADKVETLQNDPNVTSDQFWSYLASDDLDGVFDDIEPLDNIADEMIDAELSEDTTDIFNTPDWLVQMWQDPYISEAQLENVKQCCKSGSYNFTKISDGIYQMTSFSINDPFCPVKSGRQDITVNFRSGRMYGLLPIYVDGTLHEMNMSVDIDSPSPETSIIYPVSILID